MALRPVEGSAVFLILQKRFHVSLHVVAVMALAIFILHELLGLEAQLVLIQMDGAGIFDIDGEAHPGVALFDQIFGNAFEKLKAQAVALQIFLDGKIKQVDRIIGVPVAHEDRDAQDLGLVLVLEHEDIAMADLGDQAEFIQRHVAQDIGSKGDHPLEQLQIKILDQIDTDMSDVRVQVFD